MYVLGEIVLQWPVVNRKWFDVCVCAHKCFQWKISFQCCPSFQKRTGNFCTHLIKWKKDKSAPPIWSFAPPSTFLNHWPPRPSGLWNWLHFNAIWILLNETIFFKLLPLLSLVKLLFFFFFGSSTEQKWKKIYLQGTNEERD